MKLHITVAILGLGMTTAFSQSLSLNSLDDLQWKNRIILVNGSSENLAQFDAVQAEIAERDVIWFLVASDAIYTNSQQSLPDSLGDSLRSEYFQNGVTAVLIGKDGSLKLQQTHWDATTMFNLIDTMPMRRQEMQSK